MTKQLMASVISLMLAACARPEPPEPAQLEQESLRCSAYGGLTEHVCPTSIYSVLTSPAKYYGRVVAFKGFVHQSQSGVISVYPSEALALNSDSASSVLCASDKESCDNFVGSYAEVFGAFSASTTPDSLFKPVGTLSLLHVRSFKSPHGR